MAARRVDRALKADNLFQHALHSKIGAGAVRAPGNRVLKVREAERQLGRQEVAEADRILLKPRLKLCTTRRPSS